MPRTSQNTQMFALPTRPPERIEIGGYEYRLVRVFKHDFWAATILYEAGPTSKDTTPPEIPKVVVKLGRQQSFCGLPLGCYARLLLNHERDIYRTLAGIEGVPRWVGSACQTGIAIEYIDALPLDHFEAAPPGFFDALREIFDAIHARGVAYCDANKRSNILVTDDGKPVLVDFQISIRRRDNWIWPLRSIVRAMVDYLSEKDIYHLYKHKRFLAPAELTAEEAALARPRGWLHQGHRKLTKPYRYIRRRFLQKQYAKGALQSPTAELEDHHQPEKDTWRRR